MTQSKIWQPGTLCITIAANIADTAILKIAGCFPDSIVGFNADPEKSDIRFVKYALDIVKREFQDISRGTTQDNLSVDKLLSVGIPCPSAFEQRRIADVLCSYDDLIENNTRRIAILEDMARRLFEEWFIKSAVDGLPAGWSSAPLRDILTLRYGKALRADTRIDGPVPVYGSSGKVGSHNVALVTGPGIILGRKGNVGSVFYSPCDFYPIDTVFYVETDMPLQFICHNLRRQNFTNSDSAVPGLNRESALSKEIALPPCDQIDRFEGWASPVVQHVLSLRDANTNLRATRDLLLPKLISGEIEVGVAEETLEASAA